MSRQARNLADLLQEAEQLTADIDTGSELPRVKRNLQQIADASQRLLNRSGVPVDENTDVKASILLGARGIDLPRISQRLESLNAAKTLEPIEPVWETDIEGFLRNERENMLLSVIEESRKNTFAEAKRRQWQCVETEWEKEKEKLLNSLLGTTHDILELPTEAEVISSNPLSVPGRSSLNAVELAYAREVYCANDVELKDLSHSLVNEFYNASKSFVDKGITNSWLLLKMMVDLPSLPPDAYDHRSSPTLQRGFVQQAQAFLEQQYLEYVMDLVYSTLPRAQLGGVPGTLQLVRSYLSLKQANNMSGLEDGLVEGQPLWALIFYCLRCGDFEDALQVALKAGVCPEFAVYLQDYMNSEDRRLSPDAETRVQMEYRRNVRSSTDPFKRAVYCLLGRCDNNENHSQVIAKTEDYMWLKLYQVYFEPPESTHIIGSRGADHMTLSDLQKQMQKDYGESHFNAHQHPHLYFQVLLLTAQFEAAVEFLSRVETLRSHAVHFALALHDLNLLNLTESFHTNLLVEEPNGVFRLNLGRLVVGYTRSFALTDPREALEYFYRLRKLQDGRQRNLFLSCVSDLVKDSREFEMLLGKIQPDGTRKPGCIDKFYRDTSSIISFVADEAEVSGLFEDAVRLYDLAKNHNKAVEVLNLLLSRVVSAPSVPQSDRHRLQALAIGIADRYRSMGHSASQQLSSTFFLLLDIMQFFDQYHAKRIDVAFEIVKQLRLLPLQHGDTVEQAVATFRGLDDQVRQCYPDLLLASMSIIYTLYKQSCSAAVQSKLGQDGGQEVFQAELRGLARALITFAGMLPYQMPGDVNARLVQMEVLMQ